MLTSIIITSSVVEWFYRLTAKVSLGDRGEGGGAVNRLPNLRSYLAKYTKLSVSLLDWRRQDITKMRGESSFLKG